MFCPNCGAKNLAAAPTCLDCGRPLPHSPGSPGASSTSSASTTGPAAPPAEAPRILRKPGPLAPAPLDNVPRATTTKMATLSSQVAAGTAPASVLPPPSLTTPSRPPPSQVPDHSAVSTSSRPAPIGDREVTQPFIVHPDITAPLSRSSGSPVAPAPTQQVSAQQPPRTSPSSSIFETAPMLPSIPELRTAPAAPRPAAPAPFPAPVSAPTSAPLPPPPPSAPQQSTARMPSVPTPMPMPAPMSAPPAQPTPLFVPQPVALRAPQKPDIDEVSTEPERMIPQRPPVVSPPSFASSSSSSSMAPASSLPPLQATMPAPAPVVARQPQPPPTAAPMPAPAAMPSPVAAQPKPTWAAPAKTAVPDAVKPTRVEYASWWRQWFAAIVDGIGVVAVIAGLLRVGFAIADLKPTTQTLIDTLHGNLLVAVPVVVAFPIGFALWHLLAVPLKGTIGQRLVGLRLVNGRGKPANVVRLVIRALVNGVFGALFLVGPAYALLLDGRRRGPGDIVARTVAVYRPRAKR